MIKFRLRCGNGHEYDSMFNSGDAFDKLQRAKKLVCEVCGDKRIEKGIMAPAIRTGSKSDQLAELDAIEAQDVLLVPDVGNIAECIEAADDGDPVARKLLSGPVTGHYSDEDLPLLKERGTFITGPHADDDKVIEHEPKERKRVSKARRPSASTKSDAKKKPKKTVRRDVN
ncbi:MAG: DUF1178 family protein [Alphaproteobacteria bacterium]|nr:DUF1178 family protein [Alphaproteobacteria bacterium]